MIKAVFERSGGEFKGFSVSGHSGYSESGSDIVCASVSSAVMLSCNAATEVFKLKADVKAGADSVSLRLHDNDNGVVRALYEHLKALEEDYPENITVKISEV